MQVNLKNVLIYIVLKMHLFDLSASQTKERTNVIFELRFISWQRLHVAGPEFLTIKFLFQDSSPD